LVGERGAPLAIPITGANQHDKWSVDDLVIIPDETSYPASRCVVERSLGWLAKRSSIKIRWSKKPENWLAFLKLALAHILLGLILG
jgi:hypothetical protein